MYTIETRPPQPTTYSACDSIHAFSSYVGIDPEKYIEWETKIDCLFAKYVMCERKKIKLVARRTLFRTPISLLLILTLTSGEVHVQSS